MKSLKQYLAESEKTYEFKLRSVVEMSDAQLDKLERYLARYNVESVSTPRKSIMQKSPAGFGDYGPAEVHSIDFKTRMPASPNALHEEIARAIGVAMGAIRVHNASEAVLFDDVDETKSDENKSVLADADYKESEKVDHSENYGNEFVEKFVKNLPKSDLQTEYKV